MDAPDEEFGPYLVYEQIGVGGMATVHRAETTGIAGFRKPVALKRMLPHVAANAELVKSFVREARLASHLRHSNVAQTYDLGKVGDIYFIAMELVPGRNLRELLRHCAKTQIRIPIPITLNVLAQICDALDYAHNLCDDSGQPFGIIHRDVSPSNVIISDTGLCKLIDFGIAKASAAGMQTLSGTLKGKFGYMAPEYLEGKLDSRADLFALGIIAYELLTNKQLFHGNDDMDTLYRVRSMPITPPSRANPEVPMEIDSIVMTALERDPEARWQKAQAMRVAITTETKRLDMTMLDQQIVEWCDWAFAQTGFDADSSPPTLVLDDKVPNPIPTGSSARAGVRRPSSPRLFTPTPAPPKNPSASKLPLAAPPPSGERTRFMKKPVAIGEVPRPASAAEATEPVRASTKTKHAHEPIGNLTITVLLLLCAAGAGAVVYFGLPYIQ